MCSRQVVTVVRVALLLVAHLALAARTSRILAAEQLGGALGGAIEAGLGIAAVALIAPSIPSRTARIAVAVCGVTFGGRPGATSRVLVAARTLGEQGNVVGCWIGALAGGPASAFVEPLFGVLGFEESTTEFLGVLLSPLVPAVGAAIGFNRNINER